ncbi:MAG: hypothetical protein CMN77_05960 [Spirochaetaceae bacterium]|nr:hypothetical protein [Spirochaetaceae bacterium]
MPQCVLHPVFDFGSTGEEDQDFSSLLLLGAALSSTTVLKYGYVANQGDASIGMYSVDDSTGVWTALSPATIASGGGNTGYLVIHPTSPFLYATNQSGDNISMFRIGSDGQLSQLSPFNVATSGTGPIAIAIHPSGLFGYVGFNVTAQIEIYNIDPSTGQWTFFNSIAGCSAARELEFHPNGNFLYALCSGGSEIRIHSIASGDLTYIGSAGTGSQPNGLTLTGDLQYLYATSQGSNQVRMFSVNSTSGGLTVLSPANIGTDTRPAEIVVDAQSRYAYVNCWQSAALTVRMYDIAADGQLSDKSPNSVPTGGDGPINMDIDPTGRYVYVSNSVPNNINMYSIGSTGILTSNGLLPTGSGPRGIAIYAESLISGDSP